MLKQIIGISLLLLLSVNSVAFQDQSIHKEINDLKARLLHAQSPQQRLDHLEKFKDFLFNHLQSMPRPKNALERKEFSELNDFQTFVFSIDMKKINKETCQQNQNKIIGSFVINKDYDQPEKIDVTAEAQEALQILEDLCQ